MRSRNKILTLAILAVITAPSVETLLSIPFEKMEKKVLLPDHSQERDIPYKIVAENSPIVGTTALVVGFIPFKS